ncbi:hypothetical protein Syun_025492 [Stephania yunnanensis]|uniref:Uncharacterized protein n=1 Tax=Stephania yunnanensis TaxID=152371 RepID=A0AAP0EX41_9MAGN
MWSNAAPTPMHQDNHMGQGKSDKKGKRNRNYRDQRGQRHIHDDGQTIRAHVVITT